MSAAGIHPPLIMLCGYSPAYKLEVRLHQPLWDHSASSTDVTLEVTTLCSILEALCDKELNEQPHSPVQAQGSRRRKFSNTFESQAMILVDRMNKELAPPQPSLGAYLQQSGLSLLFPRAALYIEQPHDFHSSSDRVTEMDRYLPALTMLNQLVGMSEQIADDVSGFNNHKYIAHELALLYQSINYFKNCKSLLSHKTNIETGFKKLKSSLEHSSDDTSAPPPHLTPVQKDWIFNLTDKIKETIINLNPELSSQLQPVLGFFQKLNT